MKLSFFKWKPLSTRQKKVMTWWCDDSPYKDKDGIIADGSIRSGKTISMGFSFVEWAMTQFNGEDFIMAGKTIGALRRNVINKLKLQLKAEHYKVEEKHSDNSMIVSKNGVTNKFYFFGGDKETSQDLVQGLTAAGAYFDEVALMPESFVNQATARCSVEGSKLWFNCNPLGPYHWFYVNWIKKAKKRNLIYLHFTMDDNLTLSDKKKKSYENQYSGVFFLRYIKGLWVAAEGIIYDMFSRNTHVLDTIPETEGNYYVSSDFGTQNATVFLLWRKEKGRNRWIALDEYYYSGKEEKAQKTVSELVDGLSDMLDVNGVDKPKRSIVDPSAASLITEMRRRKYSVLLADNDVLNGISDVSSMLGINAIAFSRKCKKTIQEFGLYCWDSKATDRGEDKPVKTNDHCMDAVRYFVRTLKLALKATKIREEV